jgi:hypothetical protein
MNIFFLPEEIIAEIVKYLRHEDLLALESTCTYFRGRVFDHIRKIQIRSCSKDEQFLKIIPRYSNIHTLNLKECSVPPLESISHLTSIRTFTWIPKNYEYFSIPEEIALFLINQPLVNFKTMFDLKSLSEETLIKLISLSTLRYFETRITEDLISYINPKCQLINVYLSIGNVLTGSFNWSLLSHFENISVVFLNGCPISTLSDINSLNNLDKLDGLILFPLTRSILLKRELLSTPYTNIIIHFESFLHSENHFEYFKYIRIHPTLKFLTLTGSEISAVDILIILDHFKDTFLKISLSFKSPDYSFYEVPASSIQKLLALRVIS